MQDKSSRRFKIFAAIFGAENGSLLLIYLEIEPFHSSKKDAGGLSLYVLVTSMKPVA